MNGSIPESIGIHSSGESLILPAGFPATEIATIRNKKSQILLTLRSKQMDPAGFYRSLPSAICQEIEAASWVVLDLMTTAETRFSEPERLSAKKVCVGCETWLSYRATHAGTRASTKPRMRILALYTPILGACAWDLDALTPEERQRLFRAALENKILIAHNAGAALSWLCAETSARPKFVLDTMLLVRQLRPELLLRPFKMALSSDESIQMRARKLIEQENGAPAASLDWIGTSLHLPVPDARYQNHTSWCVSTLSADHHSFATMGVDLPLLILQFLLPTLSVEEMPAAIQNKYPWYVPFSMAIIRLAEAHARGVPFDAEASERLCGEFKAAALEAADELIQIPEFAPFYPQLVDLQRGEPSELADAFEKYAVANGIAWPETKIRSFSPTQAMARISGIDTLAAWNLLRKIRINKWAYRAAQQYQQAAARDGRLHSLVTFRAATGRTTSTAPTLQNIPRDQSFRSLIRARAGYLILAADYGAIELRIAAVLAERAISDLRERVTEDLTNNWFLECIRSGVQAAHKLRCPAEPDNISLNWLKVAIPSVAQTVLRRDVQRMTSVFLRGLDPHLVTALDMARRAGQIDCGPNPVEWLAKLDKQTLKKLKLDLHDGRQKAKPANFGLLYGISASGLHTQGVNNYGLSWSLAEASQARQAWFALYPEFRLWNWWTRFLQCRHISQDICMTWNPYERELVSPERRIKVYETTTLSGRPLKLLDEPRQALNYQDQGSGADILARAIADLPDDVASMMLMPVHDELVFEVPADQIERTEALVVETMTQAAQKVLGGKVPVEVETTVDETWRKG
ncbi:MAG: DNA polymerase [Acidobacteriaceae bacterium]